MMSGVAVAWGWLGLLAQSAPRGNSAAAVRDILIYGGLLLLGLIVLGVVAFVVRKYTIGGDSPFETGPTFSMTELKRLRNQGDISEEEYERAKAVLLAQGLASLQRGGSRDSDNQNRV